MRLFVTALALACGPGIIAQTQAADAPAPKPTVMSQTPAQRPRLRPAARPGAAPNRAKPASVPPSTPVVTLQGVCAAPQAKGICKTVITREELDGFVNATDSQGSEAARGRLAVQYARSVAYSALAERQGFEKNPVLARELEVQMKLLRTRILANAYLQSVQNQTASVPETEIRKYYDDHQEQYTEAQVRRVAVPLLAPTENARRLDHAAIKAEMEALQKRAAAGEDLNELQQEAFKHLHIQATPPPVSITTLRKTGVQGDEAKAFDMNPGEISAVLDLPAAFAFVKLESKETTPFESVRQDIGEALRRARVQEEVARATKKIGAQFNLPYFGLSSQPNVFGPAAIGPAASLGSGGAAGARP